MAGGYRDLSPWTHRFTGHATSVMSHCCSRAMRSTIVARKRNEAARMADATGADFIVMDDGFQNFTVAKDISLIVIDAEAGFGNGKIIPAGPLREPVHAGLRRADAVVLTGGGTPAIPSFGGPIFRMSVLPENPGLLRGRAVMAFAGIGRPAKFFAMLVPLWRQSDRDRLRSLIITCSRSGKLRPSGGERRVPLRCW